MQYANSFIVLSMLIFVSAKKCVNLVSFITSVHDLFISNRDDQSTRILP